MKNNEDEKLERAIDDLARYITEQMITADIDEDMPIIFRDQALQDQLYKKVKQHCEG